MGSFVRRQLGRLVHALGGETVRYNGVVLPAPHLRFGGPEFRDDEYFLRSAREEADRLMKRLGMTKESRLLDVGCGVGRLPIGILSSLEEVPLYWGLDVSERSVRWCQRHIESHHANFRFLHLDVQNARYRPAGHPIDQDFRLPGSAGSFDIVYLYSVFSHMLTADVKAYLSEFSRLVVAGGRVFLTAFVEQGVPQVLVNPTDYRMAWHGSLHCVRYDREFFEGLIADAGFRADDFEHGVETDGQSGIYLTRLPGANYRPAV